MTLMVMGWPTCNLPTVLCRANFPCKDTCSLPKVCVDVDTIQGILTGTGACSFWLMGPLPVTFWKIANNYWGFDSGFGLPDPNTSLGLGRFRLYCNNGDYTMRMLDCPSAGYGGPGQWGVEGPENCFTFTLFNKDDLCPGCYEPGIDPPRSGTITICITVPPNEVPGIFKVACDPECCCVAGCNCCGHELPATDNLLLTLFDTTGLADCLEGLTAEMVYGIYPLMAGGGGDTPCWRAFITTTNHDGEEKTYEYRLYCVPDGADPGCTGQNMRLWVTNHWCRETLAETAWSFYPEEDESVCDVDGTMTLVFRTMWTTYDDLCEPCRHGGMMESGSWAMKVTHPIP